MLSKKSWNNLRPAFTPKAPATLLGVPMRSIFYGLGFVILFSVCSAAHAGLFGDTLLRGLGLESFVDYPTLPDPRDLLIGQPPEPTLSPLGMPQGSVNIGTSQLITYRSSICLSRPDCKIRGGCQLSLTITDNKITDARTEGVVMGDNVVRDHFAPKIVGFCAGGYWSKLKGYEYSPV